MQLLSCWHWICCFSFMHNYVVKRAEIVRIGQEMFLLQYLNSYQFCFDST